MMTAWLARRGVAGSFLWGAAEATLFFIVPDVGVGLVALYRPRKAVPAALAAIGGALVGGTVLWLVGQTAGDGLMRAIAQVPAITPHMVERARGGLLDDGGVAIARAQLQGIPYKIYAAQWTARGLGLPALLAWTIPARAVRLIPYALFVAGIGTLFRRSIAAHPRPWLAFYLSVWTGIYTAYFAVNGF